MSSADRRHPLARRMIVTAVVAGLGLAASPAMAQTTVPAPTEPQFSGLCRGTAVKTGNLVVLKQGLTLASANPAETPCKTARAEVINTSVPLAGTSLAPLAPLLGVSTGTLLTLGVVEGFAADRPGGNGTGATARVAFTTLNVLGLVIEIGAVETLARTRLDDCVRSHYNISFVAHLKINGKVVFTGGNPATIPLPGLGAIHVNQVTKENTHNVTRGVFIDLPGTSLDVVLAESKSNAACVAPTPAL